MPHADSLALPDGLSRSDFYTHVCSTAEALLTPTSPSDPCNFVTILSNAASLLFGSYENYDEGGFGREDGKRVNWAGFYLVPSLLTRSISPTATPTSLYLGPFHGRPACQSVSLVAPSSSRPVGVCAASYLSKETVVVPNVEERPGHIACDGVTKSEIVVPISVRIERGQGQEVEDVMVGVLDIDCERVEAFDEVDREGLEKFVEVLKKVIKWEL